MVLSQASNTDRHVEDKAGRVSAKLDHRLLGKETPMGYFGKSLKDWEKVRALPWKHWEAGFLASSSGGWLLPAGWAVTMPELQALGVGLCAGEGHE